MFSALMKDPKICAGVIERVLGIKADKIKYPTIQKELKPYNLDYFRSVRLQASEGEIRRIVSWLEGDALMAIEKDMDSENGELVYALMRFATNNGKNKVIPMHHLFIVDTINSL